MRIKLVVLFCIVVIAGVLFCHMKYRALAYQIRDFPYYMQFASKLLDHQAHPRYTLNPQGYNIFRHRSYDGIGSLHRSIHFEPIKYVYGALYGIVPYVPTVFAFIAFLYFLPLVYVSFIPLLMGKKRRLFLLLFVASYILYPGTMRAIAYDAKPYSLFVPFFSMVVLAIVYNRPFREFLLWVFCIFCVREEALIFNAILLVLYCVYRPPAKFRMVVLLGMYALYAFVLRAYYGWADFPFERTVNPITANIYMLLYNRTVISMVALVFVLLWAYFVVRSWREGKVWARKLLCVAVFASLFIPLGWQLLIQFDRVQSTKTMYAPLIVTADYMINMPHFSIYFASLLLFIVMLNELFPRNLVRWFCTALVGGIALGSVYVLTQSGGYSALYRMFTYWDMGIASQPVFDLRESTDKYNTSILCDYRTYQAFYDYERVHVYNQLTCRSDRSLPLCFPDNRHELLSLINLDIDYIVVNAKNRDDIEALLGQSMRKPLSSSGNELFTVYRFCRASHGVGE